MKRFSAFLICIASIGSLSAQAPAFVNGSLDGTVGSNPPTDWSVVPYGDPTCQAADSNRATSDVLSATGYFPAGGLIGNPYEGTTFVSGLHITSTPGVPYFHEGIQQLVEGFVVGQPYTVSFYQNVTKQDNVHDSTGRWAVYLNNTLVGYSATCYDPSPIGSLNHPWFLAGVSFYATATSHWIKFLPRDDDPYTDYMAGVRMGIDKIVLTEGASYPLAAKPSQDSPFQVHLHHRILQIDHPQGKTFDVLIHDLQGQRVFQGSGVREADLSTLSAGVYVLTAQVRQAPSQVMRQKLLLY